MKKLRIKDKLNIIYYYNHLKYKINKLIKINPNKFNRLNKNTIRYNIIIKFKIEI